MARQIYILLIVTLGFFLAPSVTHACGKSKAKTEKSCCNKKASQTKKKSCCKNQTDKQNDKDGCDGKCGHSTCQCTTVCFGCTLPLTIEPKYITNVLIVAQKQYFFYSDPNISSGYYSIWQPPKLG